MWNQKIDRFQLISFFQWISIYFQLISIDFNLFSIYFNFFSIDFNLLQLISIYFQLIWATAQITHPGYLSKLSFSTSAAPTSSTSAATAWNSAQTEWFAALHWARLSAFHLRSEIIGLKVFLLSAKKNHLSKQLDTIVDRSNKPYYCGSGLLMDYPLVNLFGWCFNIFFKASYILRNWAFLRISNERN